MSEVKRIEWVDSNTYSGWHYPKDHKYEPMTVITVGWCIAEDDACITISSSVVFGEFHQVSDTITIPKVCIVSMETVGENYD